MNDMFTDDDRTDAWLIDASRKLDEPTGDVERLINSITAGLGRVRRPTRTLATDDSAIAVSDRVIRQLLATRVRVATGRLVVSAIVEGDGDAVTGVTLGLIARYLDDPQLRERMGRQAREWVLAERDWSDVTKIADEAYHRLLG